MLPAVKPSFDRWFFSPSLQTTALLQLANFYTLQFSMFFLGVTSPDLTTLTRSSRNFRCEPEMEPTEAISTGQWLLSIKGFSRGFSRLCKERC